MYVSVCSVIIQWLTAVNYNNVREQRGRKFNRPRSHADIKQQTRRRCDEYYFRFRTHYNGKL